MHFPFPFTYDFPPPRSTRKHFLNNSNSHFCIFPKPYFTFSHSLTPSQRLPSHAALYPPQSPPSDQIADDSSLSYSLVSPTNHTYSSLFHFRLFKAILRWVSSCRLMGFNQCLKRATSISRVWMRPSSRTLTPANNSPPLLELLLVLMVCFL